MSGARDDGGPAYPVQDASTWQGHGMTLRDHFAGLAMQGMVSGHFSHYGHENFWQRDGIAGEAYEMADAMLKTREA